MNESKETVAGLAQLPPKVNNMCGCQGLCKQKNLASDEVSEECKAVYGPNQPKKLKVSV